MLTLQLKTTRIILINNLNNLIQQLARQSTPCRAQGISSKCHQVYKSQKLNQKLSKICLISMHSAQICTAISYSRPRTRVDVYRKHLCTSVYFTLPITFSCYLFHSYLVDIQSIRVLYDRLTVAAQIYSPFVQVTLLIAQLPSAF